jgi:hypothetical protein
VHTGCPLLTDLSHCPRVGAIGEVSPSKLSYRGFVPSKGHADDGGAGGPGRRSEILGGLADAGEEVLHVFWELDAEVLASVKRIRQPRLLDS